MPAGAHGGVIPDNLKIYEAAVALNGQIVATMKLGPVVDIRDLECVPQEGDDIVLTVQTEAGVHFIRGKLKKIG